MLPLYGFISKYEYRMNQHVQLRRTGLANISLYETKKNCHTPFAVAFTSPSGFLAPNVLPNILGAAPEAAPAAGPAPESPSPDKVLGAVLLLLSLPSVVAAGLFSAEVVEVWGCALNCPKRDPPAPAPVIDEVIPTGSASFEGAANRLIPDALGAVEPDVVADTEGAPPSPTKF